MASFSIPQFENEPFWRYFNRVQDSLPSNYWFNIWEICEVIFEGLNHFTRYIVVYIKHDGRFRALSLEEAWDFCNIFAQETYEEEMSMFSSQGQPNYGIPLPSFPNCSSMHSIYNDSYLSSTCMNYNVVSLYGNSDLPMASHDFPQPHSSCDDLHSHEQNLSISLDCKHHNHDSHASNDDSCDNSSSFIDSQSTIVCNPNLTLGDCFPQLIEAYDKLIASEFDNLENHEIGGKKYREILDSIGILMRKRNSCENDMKRWSQERMDEMRDGIGIFLRKSDSLGNDMRRWTQGCEDEIDEPRREEKEERIENVVDESRCVSSRKKSVFQNRLWSDDEDDSNFCLMNPVQEERNVDSKGGCESSEPIFAYPSPIEPTTPLLSSPPNPSLMNDFLDEGEENFLLMVDEVFELHDDEAVEYEEFSSPFVLHDSLVDPSIANLYSKDNVSFFSSSFYSSFSSFSYFLEFSFDSSHFLPFSSCRHRVFLHFVQTSLLTLAYVMLLESCASAYDKLLRSLRCYLLVNT